MDSGWPWDGLVPAPFRRLPVDLRILVAYLGTTTAVALVPGLDDTALRVVLGLPLVLFVPGYLLIAALFPETGPPPAAGASRTGTGIDRIERVVLSIGTSVVVASLLGLLLHFAPVGVRLVPTLVALLLVCGVLLVVAARRRAALPADERFAVEVTGALDGMRAEFADPDTRTDAALNVLLAASVLLAVASLGYATTTPNRGEPFTEFYLLTENESGDLVADGYPAHLTRKRPASLVVGIRNHEGEPVRYTVIVELRRIGPANRSGGTAARPGTEVGDARELGRWRPRLRHNGTWHRRHTIRPPISGDGLRLVYLLYRGAPPDTPTTGNAYRTVRLRIDVPAAASNATALRPRSAGGDAVGGVGNRDPRAMSGGDAPPTEPVPRRSPVRPTAYVSARNLSASSATPWSSV